MDQTTTFGALCLLPPLIVIIVAIITKRAFEPLLIGSFVGYLLIDKQSAFSLFTAAITKALKDDSMVWIILVCGMYGAVIELLVRSGATVAFGEYVVRYIKTKKQALFAVWAVGGFMFLDDYMSALSVGNTMKKVTDKFNISRITLAYLVNTTAVPICVIVPLSTWSIYCGKIIAKEFKLADNAWFDAYWNTIPYVFYAWMTLIISLFVVSGWIPMSSKLLQEDNEKPLNEEVKVKTKARFFDFFIPLLFIILATVFSDPSVAGGIYNFFTTGKLTIVFSELDALKGIYLGLIFTIAYFWLRKLMTYDQIFEGGFDGFKSMIFALAILTVTYVLKDVGERMGLTAYVIEGIKPIVSKEYLAAVVFVALAFISYTTASSWGLYLVAIPIVVPLANVLGANVWLCLGAVISSGAMGSNASLYSDCTILTSNSCEVNPVKHSMSQLPYALLSAGLATVLYVVMGHFS